MPFCPQCNQEQKEEARCPTCRCFFVERVCGTCNTEVLPKERYCGWCGSELGKAPVQVAAQLSPAPVMPRLVAGCVDLVVLTLTTEMMSAVLPVGGPAQVAAAIVLTVIAYYGVFQAAGRQTLGQYVLKLTTLGEDRFPLSLRHSLLRSLAALCGWAVVLVPLTILLDREKRGWLDRKLRVRVWSTP